MTALPASQIHHNRRSLPGLLAFDNEPIRE